MHFLIGECLGLFVVWRNVSWKCQLSASKPCWNKPLFGMSVQLVEMHHLLCHMCKKKSCLIDKGKQTFDI